MAVTINKKDQVVKLPPRPIYIGAGWNMAPEGMVQDEFDLDPSAVLRDATGDSVALCYYDQLDLRPEYGVEHSPDNRSGEGEGDDEWIKLDLHSLPPNVKFVDIYLDIYEGVKRGQHLGMVEACDVHVDDVSTGQVMIQYPVSDDLNYFGETGFWVCRFQRNPGGWEFQAKGLCDSTTVDLNTFANSILP